MYLKMFISFKKSLKTSINKLFPLKKHLLKCKKKKSPVHWPQQHNSGGQFYSSEPLSTRGRVTSSLLNTNVSANQICKCFHRHNKDEHQNWENRFKNWIWIRNVCLNCSKKRLYIKWYNLLYRSHHDINITSYNYGKPHFHIWKYVQIFSATIYAKIHLRVLLNFCWKQKNCIWYVVVCYDT